MRKWEVSRRISELKRSAKVNERETEMCATAGRRLAGQRVGGSRSRGERVEED